MIPKHSLFGPSDPAPDTGYADPPKRKGFFTDTSICIGCKACEVACKEWNEVPDDGFNMLGYSYDNTGSLNADTSARRTRACGPPSTSACRCRRRWTPRRSPTSGG
jgi:Fe-S-cluster-containing dehydrogenase component